MAVAVVPLCACAGILGIDDGHPRLGPDGGGDGSPGTVDDAGGDAGDLIVGDGALADALAGDSSSGLGTLPDGGQIPSGCENVTADPATGLFVNWKSGQDSPTCGSLSSPCQTVQQGINQAHDAPQTPNVYVADGTYTESIVLKAGVNVYGGWTTGTGAWARECSQATTVIAAPATTNVTVTASAIAGSAKLSTLTLESKGPSEVQPGESIFGIVATDPSTTLTLVYVTVTTASGGGGAVGAQGDAGNTPSGPCGASAGDGGSGSTPGTKGLGADAGWFIPSGYVATAGAAGNAGAPGANGTAGGADTCVACVTCTGDITTCNIATSVPSCGTPGQAGCGGGAGLGGAGGAGGGSSVALLVWDATINLTMSVLQAGGGGDGAGGAPGGPPGEGSSGAAGTTTSACDTECAGLAGIGCSPTAPDAGQGGHAGGLGGNGTGGGPGGDGSGGDAFAYVEGGNATIIADAFSKAAYSTGLPGGTADGGNGAPGRAAAQGP